jgi:hypothetical protein
MNGELDEALEAARARGREMLKRIELPNEEDYPDLFEIMEHPATVYRFLKQEHPEFNGLTGLDAYLTWERWMVLDAARAILEGNFS